jgi:putative membrane protein
MKAHARSAWPALILASQAIAARARACDEHAAAAVLPARRLELTHVLSWWSWDPLALVVLSISGAVYSLGLYRLWKNAGRGHGIGAWHAAAFALGWLSLVLALLSPLDTLSDILFSAHMSQHELLMVVAAPLMVVGRPWLTLLWALPKSPRRRLNVWSRSRPVQQTWRMLTAPMAALALHGLTLWIWHVPALFEAALRNEAIHAVQHASFFFTAALFFWALIHGRFGRAGYGASAFFVFVTALHSGVLGALLTVAGHLWYPLHQVRAQPWHVAALQDQQLAGLIMWVPAGAVLVIIGLVFFAAWLGEGERRALLDRRRRTVHE